MKKELTIAFLAVGLTIGMATMATAQTEQETDVDVEISGVTQLDVRPSSLTYTDSDEGDALSPGDSRTISDLGFEHIEVENIGSERIGSIYAQATMNEQQPFGTDTTSDSTLVHNTGNFVTLSLATAQSYDDFGSELSSTDTMHYLNRVEYVEDDAPTYIQTSDEVELSDTAVEGGSVNAEKIGRFKVGGAEYFFVIYETNNDDFLLIGNTPHTSTVLGTTDFTDSGNDYSVEVLEDETNTPAGVDFVQAVDFVTFDTTESGNFTGDSLLEDSSALDGAGEAADPDELIGAETRTYNLYVNNDEDYVIRTKFNVEQQSPGYNSTATEDSSNFQADEVTSGGQEYILQASDNSPDEALQPGQNFPINFGVQVPLGVDQTAIEEGTVTVISETYNGGD